jgi:hypothetical protein|tara:strand:+ start:2922 stop:3209 length:288 start_codon:yes stop_codon:yes gene_type:complete
MSQKPEARRQGQRAEGREQEPIPAADCICKGPAGADHEIGCPCYFAPEWAAHNAHPDLATTDPDRACIIIAYLAFALSGFIVGVPTGILLAYLIP